MRGLRTLIILVIVAAGLGGFIYYDSRRPDTPSTPDREKVFSVDAEKIEAITIRSESGETTELKKQGDEGWQIVSPTKAPPDPAEVSGLTSNLSSLEIERVVDENAQNLAEYGLEKPRVEITFTSGGEQHVLQIGDKTPPESDLYARRGTDNRVFLIPVYLESTFNKTTFDLRDKSAVKVDRNALDSFEIVIGNRTVAFKKSGSEWQLSGQTQMRADYSTIESLVSRVAALQMRSIVEDAEKKKTGLDKPAVTVRLNAGSSQATLAIGARADDSTVYARDLSRPLVFTVDSSILEDLQKDASEYRQKDLFDARPFNANRVEIVRGSETFAFEKTTSKNAEGQDEEKWRQVSPRERDIDQSNFTTLLSTITNTRATSFVSDAASTKAVASPELTVTIRFDDNKKEERVAFAKGPSGALAARSGEPGAAAVDTSTLESITKSLQELK